MSYQTGRFHETPSKPTDKGQQYGRTTAGGKLEGMAESKYERGSPSNENNEQMTAIENRIKQVGERLRKIHGQMILQNDKVSPDYLALEEERKDLKKEIIQLDYEHKLLHAGNTRQSRRVNEEKREQQKRQFQEKQREFEERERQYQEKQKDSKIEGQNQTAEKLAESRRKLRMAEIQAELADSRLRRSRIDRLNSELSYLRLTYTDPFLWRSYYLPSYYLPSSYYYPSTYYRYGYDLYPYSYYGLYSSPYSRWWLY